MSVVNNRQGMILSNIRNLQSSETDLYKQLESSTVPTNQVDTAKQESIVNKINELSTMRLAMFEEYNLLFKNMQTTSSKTNQELKEQEASTKIMERQLNTSKNNMNLLRSTKNNKMRMVEINTYYASLYKAQGELIKVIIIVCIPLIILAILSKKNIIPSTISTGLIGVVLIVGGVVVIRRAFDISARNNMNYDEYDWTWDSGAQGQSVYEYDKAQLTGITNTLVDDADSLAATLGIGCVGASCCADGTTFDDGQGKCVEGFSNATPQVEVASVNCPFKEEQYKVKPYSPQSTYVNV